MSSSFCLSSFLSVLSLICMRAGVCVVARWHLTIEPLIHCVRLLRHFTASESSKTETLAMIVLEERPSIRLMASEPESNLKIKCFMFPKHRRIRPSNNAERTSLFLLSWRSIPSFNRSWLVLLLYMLLNSPTRTVSDGPNIQDDKSEFCGVWVSVWLKARKFRIPQF